jgi:hypothetical protein
LLKINYYNNCQLFLIYPWIPGKGFSWLTIVKLKTLLSNAYSIYVGMFLDKWAFLIFVIVKLSIYWGRLFFLQIKKVPPVVTLWKHSGQDFFLFRELSGRFQQLFLPSKQAQRVGKYYITTRLLPTKSRTPYMVIELPYVVIFLPHSVPKGN